VSRQHARLKVSEKGDIILEAVSSDKPGNELMNSVYHLCISKQLVVVN
jgi:hypothetical protein